MSAPRRKPMFLRPAEAATLAGLSTRAIYRAIQRGELRAVRLCSRLRIPREGFEDWVARAAVRVEPRGRGARRAGPARQLPQAPRRRGEGGVMSVERDRAQGRQRRLARALAPGRAQPLEGARSQARRGGLRRRARRRRRVGELAPLDAGKERSRSSARSGGGCTPSPTSRARPCSSTPSCGTRTSCRGWARCRCAS